MKNLIANEWVDSRNRKVINVYNPFNRGIIDTIPDSTINDVNKAVSISKDSFKTWRLSSFEQRVNIFNKFLQLLRTEKKDLAILFSKESGMVIKESLEQIDNIRYIVSSIVESAKDILFVRNERYGNTIEVNMYEALGVVGVVLSSCDIIYSFCYKVFSSLIMGNTVVIKPSELVPLTVTKLAYLLRLAGIPEGVIGVIHGDGKTVSKNLAMHPFVKLVSVDGSLKTGLSIRNVTSRKLGKEMLQLNGNDALILCSDGDVSKAVDFTIKSRLSNNGQSSIGPKRFIIHEDVKEEYLTKLFASLRMVRVGDALDNTNMVSALVSEKRAKEVEMYVNKTIKEGAELLYGGHRYSAMYEPTVLYNIDKNMSIMKTTEVLGPVFPIITFNNIEEAFSIANNIPFGINNYIFTKSTDIVFKFMNDLESSSVIVNANKDKYVYNSYFGGWKLSSNNSGGLEELLKSFCIHRKVILENE